MTAVRVSVDLDNGGDVTATATDHAAVVAELDALHRAQDWTPERQERYRQLCYLERALRRRRKAGSVANS